MIFSSLEFLCVFLPSVCLLYCLMPGIHMKNALLLIASLLFYAYGEPAYVLLMIFSAAFNYIFARMIAAFRFRRALMVVDTAVNLGLLLYFKYTVFFIQAWNQATGMRLDVPDIELPVGISFFTFQAMSYVIDVYCARVLVQKSFWKLLLYISFFPQLIAGPIVKYRGIKEALTERTVSLQHAAEGFRRFICGLGKKVLIANSVGQTADLIFAADAASMNMIAAWTGAVAYMLQIYYDFSGYSDMAIGLGRMFGFRFEENFRYPYGASSVKEFWRRWHISLSSWFKEYLYIPLGGNRKGRLRTGMNKLAVFFCTGFWHGANWTFIVWGLYHGFFSALEDLVPFTKKLPKFLTYLYTMLVVCIGFVIFRADTLADACFMIRQMFAGTALDERSMSFAVSQLNPWFCTMLAAGLAGMAPVKPLVEWIRRVISREDGQAAWKSSVLDMGLYAASAALLAWCLIRLSGNTYNPFIYFRF